MPFDVSVPELLIILVAVLLIFGPKRLPEMGRSLGKGLRQFRESVSGLDELTTTTPPATPAASPTTATTATPTPETFVQAEDVPPATGTNPAGDAR